MSILPLNIYTYKGWNLYDLNRFNKLRKWLIPFHAIWVYAGIIFSFIFKWRRTQGSENDCPTGSFLVKSPTRNQPKLTGGTQPGPILAGKESWVDFCQEHFRWKNTNTLKSDESKHVGGVFTFSLQINKNHTDSYLWNLLPFVSLNDVLVITVAVLRTSTEQTPRDVAERPSAQWKVG